MKPGGMILHNICFTFSLANHVCFYQCVQTPLKDRNNCFTGNFEEYEHEIRETLDFIFLFFENIHQVP